MPVRSSIARCSLPLCVFALVVALGCSKKTTRHTGSASRDAERTDEAAAAARAESPARSSETKSNEPFAHAPVPKESLVAPPLTAPPDATTGPLGVRLQLLKQGSGKSPGPTDTIILDYSMWTGDGKLVQSSYAESRSAPFSVASISPALRAMLTSLKVGSKARYWIPRAALEGWRPKEWPDSDLIIELELVDVNHTVFRDLAGNIIEPALHAPPDAAGPPANASTTRGGLRYVLLQKGPGTRSSSAGERLSLQLDGYAIDGLVPRQVAKGVSSATTLERAPGNLAEVLSQMKSGDTARVWFPAKLGAQVIPEVGSSELVLDLKLTLAE